MNRKKIVFIGPMGAGKSTAINAVSEIPAVATEALNTDMHIVNKTTTTVAMDYGELNLGELGVIGLYGIPGQRRFDFIWPIVSKGALGAILLLDASHEDCWDDFEYFIKAFENFANEGTLMISLNRADDMQVCAERGQSILSEYGFALPILFSDPRNRNDIAMLLENLIATVETNLFLGELYE